MNKKWGFVVAGLTGILGANAGKARAAAPIADGMPIRIEIPVSSGLRGIAPLSDNIGGPGLLDVQTGLDLPSPLAASMPVPEASPLETSAAAPFASLSAMAGGLAAEPVDSEKTLKTAFDGQPSGPALPSDSPDSNLELVNLAARQAQFAPVKITADLSTLPPNEKQALGKMVQAAKIMDGLFLRQVWAGNEKMLENLRQDVSPLGQARLRYFLTNKGPWDRLKHNEAFIPGAPIKPGQANFYPQDATREEVEAWISGLPEAEKVQATGFFTVIKRGTNGQLKAVPYNVEYQKELSQASALLREAAALTEQPTLRNFLNARAQAFLSNDYYASDVAWMELNASIEPTIGPYENYEDEWFNYKAAFEAYVTVLDNPGTRELQKYSSQLQWLEDNLPIDPKDRNPKLGALSPIRVVNQVIASGDGARGVTTAAYNLPNDEKVVKEKGSKRTMLKNVQEAKFKTVLVPISKASLAAADQANLDFQAFFTHILMHELMHGLGPHDIHDAQGRPTTARLALKETFSALEEAKADISGLWALQKLIDKGQLDKSLERTMYDTFLASSFRTIRFGVGEAHGKGMAMQLNYLLDEGGVVVAKDGTFAVDRSRIKAAVESLTRKIMTIQARGDYAAARDLLGRLGVVRPEVQAVIDRLTDVPVDIEPR